MATLVQGSSVPFTVSTDSGSTYRTLVCNKAWGLTLDVPVNEDESDCGVHIGLGAVRGSFSIEGSYSTDPSSTEIGGEELIGLIIGKTEFAIKCQYPTSGTPGANLFVQANAYLTNFAITKATNAVITFTGTITLNGTIDISA